MYLREDTNSSATILSHCSNSRWNIINKIHFSNNPLFYLIFSVSVAICESVHRKKWMHVGHAVEMDQHVRNQCINGIWLQCLCVQPLAVEVSQYFNTHIFERLKMDFNQNQQKYFNNFTQTTQNTKHSYGKTENVFSEQCSRRKSIQPLGTMIYDKTYGL